jgi:Bacterial Ig-like domain (group 3)
MAAFVKQMTPVLTAHGANTNGVANDFAALLLIQTTSGTLPAAVVGVPYNNGTGYQFVASGGSGTIQWTTSGALPTGLTLSPSGLLSGTPSGAGAFTFDVTASDGSATPQTATQTISMTVAARTTSTTLALAQNPIVVNAVVTATVTVTDTQPVGNKSFPSGTVTVGSGAVTGSCSLSPTASPGVSTCQASLSAAAAGSYPLTAAFTATTVHAASSSSSVTLTVNPRATTTIVTFTPNPATVLSSSAVKATVADVDAAGLKSSPAGVITISSSVAGDVFSPPTCPLSASDSTTSACSVTFTPESNVARTITASYGGSTVHAPSGSGGSLAVKGNTATTITSILPSPVAVGVQATVSVAVAAAPPAAGTPTGTVTVSGGAAGGCTVTLASGTGSCVWTPLSGGSVSLTATYGGDSFFNPSTATSVIPVAVYYAFTGFLTPMAAAGTLAAPSFSGTSTYGSAQPIKWQLKNSAGNYISDLATALSLQGVPYTSGCSGQATGTPVLLYTPTTGAKGGSTFRYDAGNKQFIFNWNTGYMPGPGCYELELQLNDGSPIRATIERLQ